MYDDKFFWVAAQIFFGIGTRKAHRIFKDFSHPKEVLEMSEGEWLTCPSISNEDKKKYGELKKIKEKALAIYEKSLEKGIAVLTPDDDRYPKRLLNIYSPALALYAYGDVSILEKQLLIAVVGTRKPDAYGMRACKLLSCEMAEYGIPSVSGLAYGIDSVAHREAVTATGVTVAVLGNGLDKIYPSANEKLAEGILDCGGVILTEFPLGTATMPYNFPLRNRIISGLSDAVVVVQGARGSGSLITAAHCISQNRLLFAVPGNIFSELSAASNWLISQGAFVCSGVQDILNEFPYISLENFKLNSNRTVSKSAEPAVSPKKQLYNEKLKDTNAAASNDKKSINTEIPSYLSDEQEKLLYVIDKSAMEIEEIANACGMSFSEASVILTQLEILGIVKEHPGGLYALS